MTAAARFAPEPKHLLRWHLAGVYLLALLAATGLWMGEAAGSLPYPIVVAVAAAFAYFCTDLWGWWQTPLWFANLLAVAILGMTAVEFARDGASSVMALAHLLIWLQAAKFFRRKDASDIWQMLGLSLLQIAIACVLNREVGFGLILLFFGVVGVATLGLFQLRLGFRAVYAAGAPPSRRAVWSVVWRSVWLSAAALPFALILFVLTPRAGSMQASALSESSSSPIKRLTTGFSSTVKLDELGEVMSSDDVVFNVWATNRDGRRAKLPPNILWRGNVFVGYRGGEWHAYRQNAGGQRMWRDPQPVLPGQVKLRVQRLIAVRHTLFSPKPLFWAMADNPEQDEVTFLPTEGRMFHRRVTQRLEDREQRTPFVYHMIVGLGGGYFRDADEKPPDAVYLANCKAAPDKLARVRDLVQSLCRDLPADDALGKINRITAYLQRSGGYLYTLTHERKDDAVDAIEDFLFNTKAGHCEYFASSLAVMLRFADVPTRVINGFKGADYNEAGGYYQVRQFLAHSWVEAYLPGEERWMTLDPTPEAARDEMVAASRSVWQNFYEFSDAAGHAWANVVLGYSNADESQALFGVFADFFGALRDAFAGNLASLWEFCGKFGVLSFWVSGQGIVFVVAASTLLFAMFAVVRRLRRRRTTAARLQSPLAVYEDWLRFLESRGMVRSRALTPLEHARQLATTWGAGAGLAGFADLPVELAEAHYAARFGAAPATGEQVARWQRRLEELRTAWPA